MQSAYFDEEREEGHALLRRRVTGLVLALAVELLIVLILIWFSVRLEVIRQLSQQGFP